MYDINNTIVNIVDIECNLQILFESNPDKFVLKFIQYDKGQPANIPDSQLNFLRILPWRQTVKLPTGQVDSIANLATELYIDEGIKSIGAYAFYNFSKLTSISLPNTLSSVGYAAFDLTPGTDTKLNLKVVFRGNLFQWSQIDFNAEVLLRNRIAETMEISFATNPMFLASEFIADDYTEYSLIFNLPEGIKELDIHPYTFVGCPGLAHINFTQLTNKEADNTVLVKIGKRAFAYCTDIELLDLPQGNSNIYYRLADQVFEGCKRLCIISLPATVLSVGFDLFSGIPIIDAYCQLNERSVQHLSSATNTQVKWNTDWNRSVTKTYWGFKRMGITQNKIIWKQTFDDNIHIVNFQGDSVSDFKKTLVIPATIQQCPVTRIESGAFAEMHYDSLEIEVGSCPLYIGNSAFSNCKNLTEVTFKSVVTTIVGNGPEVTLDNFVFCGCDSLQEVYLSYYTSSIGIGVFYKCNKINKLVFLQPDDELTGDFTKDSVYTEHDKFDKFNITTDTESGFLVLSTADTNNILYYSIPMANGSTTLNTSVFNGCSLADFACAGATITELELQNVTHVGRSAFEGCDLLESITICFTGMDGPIEYEESAFKDCSALTDIIITDDKSTERDNINEVLTAWCNISFKNKFSNPLYYDVYYCNDNDCQVSHHINPKRLWYKSGDKQVLISGSALQPEQSYSPSALIALSDELSINTLKIPACTFLNSTVKTVNIINNDIDLNDTPTLIIEDFAFTNSALEAINFKVNGGANLEKTSSCFIGRSAFEGTALNSLTIGPTAQLVIEDFAFKNMTRLETLTINVPDSACCSLGDLICDQNYKLATLYIPTRLLSAFMDLNTISSLFLTDDTTAIPKNSLDKFVALTNLTINEFKASSKIFKYITGLSFKNCLQLKTLSVSPNSYIYKTVDNCLLKCLTDKVILIFGCNDSNPKGTNATHIQDYAFASRTFTGGRLPQLPATTAYVGRHIYNNVKILDTRKELS